MLVVGTPSRRLHGSYPGITKLHDEGGGRKIDWDGVSEAKIGQDAVLSLLLFVDGKD